jgi:hypothetical protein
MPNVTELSVPSLEEVILCDMPKLKTCTSVGDLKSNLRVLKIKRCPLLVVLDLFQKVHNYETEQRQWLPSMKKLSIRGCPNLRVMIPIPPSPTYLEIQELGSHIMIKANSVFCKCSCDNITLDEKFLSFHSMRDLMYLEISGCYNLLTISLRTFGHLISLKILKIFNSSEIIYSDEDLIPSNAGALPSLESLEIEECEITGKWLSMMLRHSPTLKELYLSGCPKLTQLQIEDDKIKNIQSNLTSAWDASSSGNNSVTASAPDGLCCIPFNLTSSLKKITMVYCFNLIFDESRKDLAGFTSLKKFRIFCCPKLFSSLVHNDGQEDGRWLLPQSLEELSIDEYSHETLRPCFVDNINHLKKLEVSDSPPLESLQLDSCMAMRYLEIRDCSSLTALEGLRSLVNLRELHVFRSPVFASLATSVECLESLRISEVSLLTTSFCVGLSCLRSLTLTRLQEARLTDEQERALLLHGSLQELEFDCCWYLLDLPAGLHNLPSLKTLKINRCPAILGLPNKGLPPSLEELEIQSCSDELSTQCRSLATGRLRVKINGHFVN